MDSATYSHDEVSDVELQMPSSGGIGVVNVDEDGNLWVTEEVEHVAYIAVDETESGGVIESYTAGVPGFGGEDAKLEVEALLIDKTPPVLSCNLGVTNGWDPVYERANIVGFGITATDDVDGDITDRITNTQTRRGPFVAGESDYGLVVVYTVSDTAGNTATMTVSYDHTFFCGIYHWWYVRAVNKG